MVKVAEEIKGSVKAEQPSEKKDAKGSCGCGCNSGTKGK
ncbi:hypothetical protein SAMN06269301_2630 [Geobacter sp. DSM 9736]|nr:hypothetical protein SAMN06269301_2630 [Geobacter sp. DSM 9736]